VAGLRTEGALVRRGSGARPLESPAAVLARSTIGLRSWPGARAALLANGVMQDAGVRRSAPKGKRMRWLVAGLAAFATLGAGAQSAVAAGGPVVNEVDCVRACKDGEPRGGSLVEFAGRNLGDVSRAYVTGGEREVADVPGQVGEASAEAVRVRLPWETVTGEFSLGTSGGRISSASDTMLEIAPIPVVAKWRCVRSCESGRKPRPGSLLAVTGVRLEEVQSVKLMGKRGRGDDRTGRVGQQTFAGFRLRVPKGARTGSLIAYEADGDRSPRRQVGIAAGRVQVAPGATTGGVFPIRGAHDYGNEISTFGNARGRPHQGHDVFAKCGTPLVAAVGGKVRYAGYQSSAGNYIVIAGSNPTQDYVYMHMQAASAYKTGARVETGAQIGTVGETGNAQGCHLHFEMWSAPGWYEGGSAFDPLPQLKAWDRET